MRTEEILIEIEKLRELEQKAFQHRHGRFEFYRYLERVLRFYWRCLDAGKRKTTRQTIAAQCQLKSRKGKRLLHFIIEATSQQPAQTRNRWVQALEFAAKHRRQIGKDRFSEFANDHGGIAGCAGRATKHRVPRPQKLKKRKRKKRIW